MSGEGGPTGRTRSTPALLRGRRRARARAGAQAKKDFQDIVLSARQDDFYQRHMYANFGDMGTAVKELVDAFQSQTATTKNVATIEDMQNFVENFSEFSAAQRNAGKHVTLMSELSRVVDARLLMQARGARRAAGRRAATPDARCGPGVQLWGAAAQVSNIEQDIVCSTASLNGHFEAVRALVENPHVTDEDGCARSLSAANACAGAPAHRPSAHRASALWLRAVCVLER